MKKTLIIALALIGAIGFNSNAPAPAEKLAAAKVGDAAPEIEMKNPDGEVMRLSDLKGKLVLVDFWASWCGPCRRENPNVVRAYDKYQKAKFKTAKGFEVFSVSLDSDNDRWKAAIKKDRLKWDYHVSDLQKWNNAAAREYGVSSIPASFLIDETGTIVASNLRGVQLDMAIDKHVAKLKR